MVCILSGFGLFLFASSPEFLLPFYAVDQKQILRLCFCLTDFCFTRGFFFPAHSHDVELLRQWFVSLNTDYPPLGRVISHSIDLVVSPRILLSFNNFLL